MSQSYQTATNSSKFARKQSSEPRSKTPKNNASELRFNQRQSRSLIKKQEPEAPFLPAPRMEPIKEWGEGTRYYYLGKGNNHEAVRRALSQRKGVAESNSHEGIFLKWTQNSFGFKYHQLGKECLCFNHFEFHREISNKQRLVWNMVTFCESNKLNAFNYIPTTFIIDLTTGEEELALHAFIKFYNRNLPQKHSEPRVHSILLPRTKYVPYMSAQQLHKRSQGNFYTKPTCPRTFFADSQAYLWILKPTFMNRGRGVSLFSNLTEFEKLIWKYYEGEGLQDYEDKQGIAELYRLSQAEDSTVQIITDDPDEKSPTKAQEHKENSTEKDLKSKTTKQKDKEQKTKEEKISPEAKPQEKSLKKIQEAKVEGQRTEERGKSNLRVLSFIVQKYIQCPMLIRQRKFDIRVWALLTQNYEVYFFREGYLRFSSHPYSTDNHTNPFIHLTNNSVQKHCNQYDEESGNQITLSDLRAHFPDDSSFTKAQARIRQMVWLSMCSARRKININGRRECFELFGYDFMVDQALKVWLIEVNTNPAIEQCSAVLRMLIPRMLDDLFKLTIDRIFGLKRREDAEEYPVKGFPIDQNMWELLGDFREGVNEKTMSKRMTLVRR